MTPERIGGWLRRPANGAKRFQLVVDNRAGISPLADWSREDAENDSGEVAASVVAQCQDYTNVEREPQKFRFRWLGARDRILGQTTHLCEVAAEEPTGTLSGVMDTNALVRELLIAGREKDKVLVEALGTITNGFKESIDTLTGQLKAAHVTIREQAERPAAEVHRAEIVPVELSEEQKEEVIRRTAALEKFASVITDELPNGIQTALAILAHRFIPDDPAKTTVQ